MPFVTNGDDFTNNLEYNDSSWWYPTSLFMKVPARDTDWTASRVKEATVMGPDNPLFRTPDIGGCFVHTQNSHSVWRSR